ncbi:MAG: hypothetical protein GF403_06010 [Candidatus Coatesbacteria bacterium]|jgi:hypothetical protein|nr:hypothetical protein [Candidatus Coatesbacteria bacterium]
MDDLRDRIADDRSSLENKLARLVPGYEGYKELKTRREADRLLREHLVGRLDELRGVLRELVIRLTNDGRLSQLKAVDAVENRLETLTDAFRHADYGYSGKTDPLKVDGMILDRLYEFDATLVEHVAEMETQGRKLAEISTEPEAVKAALLEFDTAMKSFARAARERNQILSGVEL